MSRRMEFDSQPKLVLYVSISNLYTFQWITYSRLLRVEKVSLPRSEPASYRSISRHANHSATASQRILSTADHCLLIVATNIVDPRMINGLVGQNNGELTTDSTVMYRKSEGSIIRNRSIWSWSWEVGYGMCCRLAASIMGTGPPSPGSVRVRQGPLSCTRILPYTTLPYPQPNRTNPQPYLGMGSG